MEFRQIVEKISQREAGPMGLDHLFSVVIPLIEVGGDLHILFEKRARTLRNQPNEISFPGGRIEIGETPGQAAFRETIEELMIPEENLEIIHELDYLVTRYSTAIHCFLGKISGLALEDIQGNPDEVDHVFTVPLDFFLENEPRDYSLDFTVEESDNFPYDLIDGGKDYDFKKVKDKIYFYTYEDRIIWGFTAKMTRYFIQRLKEEM